MNEGLFHITYDKWWLLAISIIPATINVGIYFYTSFFLPQNKTNRFFAFFVLLLGISQFSEGFMQMSETIETAIIWNKISSAPWIFTIPLGLLFILHFTEWYKKIKYRLVLSIIILVSTSLELLVVGGLQHDIILKSDKWNWISNPDNSILTTTILLWITLTAIISLSILWIYYFMGKADKRKKIQTFLLAIGYSFPFILGIGGQIFMPIVLKMDSIPLVTPSLTLFSICAVIAIKKYNLFDYSPRHQWDKIIEEMHEGVLIVDNNERIMFANKAFCLLAEYKFSEIDGKIASDLLLENKTHKNLIKNLIEDRKNNISSQYEIQIRSKSGKLIWVLMNGSPYIDRNGKIIGSIGIQTDISHLKETEGKLKNVNAELETYIYKASHDLKAPLSSIRGLIQVGKLELKDEVSIRYFEMMNSQTIKLDYMLSEFIKSMAIKDSNKFENVIDFDLMIKESIEKFLYFEGSKQVTPRIDISLPKPFVSNKFILESIFQNLIENAIKYRNPEEKNPYFKIDIKDASTFIKIIFEDNGIGIGEEQQDKVFNMYYRATQVSKGSGLGLYLVKLSVEKLNGQISLDSKLGVGTRFTILLPKN